MTQNPYGTTASPQQPSPGEPVATLTAPTPEPLPQYDMHSPAEPESYRVPSAYRRPYGVNGKDKRGPAWFPAFASLMCVAGAFFFGIMGSGLSLAAIIPAVAAIVLGIQALKKAGSAPAPQNTSKARGMAWGGIVGGVLAIPLAIGMFVLTSWAEDAANQGYCEYTHAGDPTAIERCLEDYGY